MFDIQANVPVPKRTNVKSSKYPWTLMDVDESFEVPDGKIKSLRTTAYAAGKRLGMKFIAREMEGGVRIWRVE